MKRPELLFYDMGSDDVTTFSTTRHGGYSSGNYGEFNINRYCGDDESAIASNRKALCQLLQIADNCLVMPHQTHQTRVAVIDEAFLQLSAGERQAALEGTDALLTNVPDICIGVSTADCMPILLYDPEHQVVGAVHAGWRGTVARIAQVAVRRMCEVYDTKPTALRAAIGPGIGLASFEVGQEVYDAFQTAGFCMEEMSERLEKWHIDLPACNRRQLTDAGLSANRIVLSGICTYQQSADYFSARRLGIASGRIFSGAILRNNVKM